MREEARLKSPAAAQARCALGGATAVGAERGALAAAPAFPRLGATKGKQWSAVSAGFADLVGSQGVLNVGQDALLSGARQLAHAFKDLPGLAGWAFAALGAFVTANK